MSSLGIRRRIQSSRGTRVVSLFTAGALAAVLIAAPATREPRRLTAFASGGDAGLADVVDTALRDIHPLQEQVEAGVLVARFGDKAAGIVNALAGRTGSEGGAEELLRAVDGMLEALFLQQCALLRQQVSEKFEKTGSTPGETIAQADQQFVVQASELKRPGSDWSFEQERYTLRATLEGTFRSLNALQEEDSRAAATQQTTVEVIGKLQGQMEALQQRLQQLKAGSPWFLSSSYRIPKTPLTLISRYQQGRASFELSLNADRDPANADAGFVDGFGPANIGVKMNVG
eukprot:TRINITY_DN6505_c0_g1_i1.p1 TRINITY_DN6505_c0_g1~~TRINITY_DN6505_c0_g1_i1.p1  ORF type:complete len:288 (+),score=59.29 TRINITY_DN6505_c0_g1_i1:65-928(+)